MPIDPVETDWFMFVWVDITGADKAWMTEEEAMDLKPAHIHTVGAVIREEPAYLVIASSIGAEGELGNLNAIPRCCIQHQVPLHLE